MARVGFSTIEFFANARDFASLSEQIYTLGLSPVQGGMLPAEPNRWDKLCEVLIAGKYRVGEWVKGPDANHNLTFVLKPLGCVPNKRPVVQKRSNKVLYVIGIQENPDSIFLSAGGLCPEGDLVLSKIYCLTKSKSAQAKFGLLKKFMIANYLRSIDRYYLVGPNAAEQSKAGLRLCVDSRSRESVLVFEI